MAGAGITFGGGGTEHGNGARREHAQVVLARKLQHVLNAALSTSMPREAGSEHGVRSRINSGTNSHRVELHGELGIFLHMD